MDGDEVIANAKSEIVIQPGGDYFYNPTICDPPIAVDVVFPELITAGEPTPLSIFSTPIRVKMGTLSGNPRSTVTGVVRPAKSTPCRQSVVQST